MKHSIVSMYNNVIIKHTERLVMMLCANKIRNKKLNRTVDSFYLEKLRNFEKIIDEEYHKKK